MNDEKLPLLDGQQQALDILQAMTQKVQAGEILSVAVMAETVDEGYLGLWSRREDVYGLGGFMISTALRQMGLAR